MLKSIFYLPTFLLRMVQLLLPRRVFIATYQPATVQERNRSITERNRYNRIRHEVLK